LNLPVILRIFKGDHLVEVKQFQLDQIVIGNQAEVNLSLNDPSVSPIHALIEKRNDTYYLCDLGSAQGTFIGANQVLDEVLESGNEIHIGGFRVQFSVGAPKPKIAAPGAIITPPPPVQKAHSPEPTQLMTGETTVAVIEPETVAAMESEIINVDEEKQGPSESEAVTVAATLPINRPSLDNGSSINKFSSGAAPVSKPHPITKTPNARPDLSKTFAPPSAVSELNQVIKASRGSVLEISIAWKERIIDTYHFRGNKTITVGSNEKADISLPGKILPGLFTLVDFQGGVATVHLSSSMTGDLILEKKTYQHADLKEIKRINTGSKGNDILRLEQGEAFRLALVPELINVYIRYVPSTQKPALVPFLPFTTGEITSVLLATAFVGLIALYNMIHAPVETPKEEIEPEIISVTKFVYPTVKPAPEKSVPPPPKTPPPIKVETPPKEKQKLVLGDKNQQATTKSEKPTQTPGQATKSGGSAGSRAAEAAPNKNTSAKKTFTSIQQGGSVKIGAQAGANASQAKKPVDLSNVGLTSTFGGGGANSKLRQAVQGAGGIIGDANQATGTAGFSKGRPGDDLGSAFKDTGAGGKGVATEGISGGITNGRGSGNSGYGGVGSGLGEKSGVSVDVGGYGASFAGTIDRNGVLRVIQNHKSVIRRCYEKELRFKTSLSGRLVVKFEIGDKGKVLSAKVDESSLDNKSVENCITNELVTWLFPEPPANSVAEVLFPFTFQNKDE